MSGSADASFWQRSMDAEDECQEMIDRRLNAYLTVLRAGLYVGLLWSAWGTAWHHVTVVRPTVRAITAATGAYKCLPDTDKKRS